MNRPHHIHGRDEQPPSNATPPTAREAQLLAAIVSADPEIGPHGALEILRNDGVSVPLDTVKRWFHEQGPWSRT